MGEYGPCYCLCCGLVDGLCVFADLSKGRVGIDKFPEDSENIQVYMDINGLGTDGYVGRFVQVTFVGGEPWVGKCMHHVCQLWP